MPEAGEYSTANCRYTHDGTLDPSLGEDGAVLLDFHDRQLSCGPTVHIE